MNARQGSRAREQIGGMLRKHPILKKLARLLRSAASTAKVHMPVGQPFLHSIDHPNPGNGSGSLNSPDFLLRGWIAAAQGSVIADVRIRSADNKVAMTAVDRPDVEAAYPGMAVFGFHDFIPVDRIVPQVPVAVEFTIDGRSHQFPVDFQVDMPRIEEFGRRKQRKLQRIQALLQCPSCAGPLDFATSAGHGLHCKACQAGFVQQPDRHFNFLSEEMRRYGAVKPTANVSAWPYDPTAATIIEELKEGVILDNGCGFRDHYYENIVNFEIVDYPTTDVLGIGERLPFKDASFDAVFSMMVLEHVKRPFECASEILRVLKPGGKLYVVAPFLQPFHGYPDHYYNMTSSGLRNLFEEGIDIVSSGVPLWGSPAFTLNWVLNSYVNGLPPAVAEKFRKMRVEDFLAHPATYLEADFITRMSPQANEELACTNFIIARKR